MRELRFELIIASDDNKLMHGTKQVINLLQDRDENGSARAQVGEALTRLILEADESEKSWRSWKAVEARSEVDAPGGS